VIVAIGSGDFYTIGGDEWGIIDSIYMTIITLSTVGFGEVYPLSDLGKLWTVIVIIFGVSGFAAILYELGAELIQMNTYRSRTMRKKISKLKSHYIICGYGRMGAGANKVVNPYITGGHRMAELLISPFVEDTVSLETPNDMSIDFSLEEFAVERLSSYDGKIIAETKLREDHGLLIVGISNVNGETELNPGSEKRLLSGQKIMTIGSQENLTRFKEDILN
jgi:Trk K+ transport system NAD-binding subunit